MNPDKNFRMNRITKRMIATVQDPHLRGELKRAMITAQLTSERTQRRQDRRATIGVTINE